MSVLAKDVVPGIYVASAGRLHMIAIRTDPNGYDMYFDYDYDHKEYRNYATTAHSMWSMDLIEYVIEEMGLP